jgi:V/A-type H+/Na+-transporting ATPase subunit B
VRRLLSIVGEGALADDDRRFLAFSDAFEGEFIGQGAGRRSITETLDAAWQLLAGFPDDELTRIPAELRSRYRAPT